MPLSPLNRSGIRVIRSIFTFTIVVIPATLLSLCACLASAQGPASVVLIATGNNQSAIVGTQFSMALTVTVTDTDDNPVSGVTVTFAKPGSKASATLTTPAITNSLGQTSVIATANGAAGSYNVTASVSGGTTSAIFALTNLPVPNYLVNATADDETGTPSNCTGSPGEICTLRDALAAADAVARSTISFDPTVFLAANSAAANTITLSNGALDIPTYTTITGLTSGSGATLTNLVTVSGNNATTVFAIASDVTSAVIANMNVANGNNAVTGQGGGILNAGTLIVTGCNFSGNSADEVFEDAGSGGAILNLGTLTVSGSTFSNNSAYDGGGAIMSAGQLTIKNSTFAGNYADQQGGAVWGNHPPVDTSSSSITIEYCTFSGNSSQFGSAIAITRETGKVKNSTVSGNSAQVGGGGGAGIFIEKGATLVISNSIVEGNDAGPGGFFPDIESFIGTLSDLGGNLINTSEDPAMVNPQLSPLGWYGGSTQTMLPQPGSEAICAGLTSNIPAGFTTDQRGYPNVNPDYPGYSASTPCVDAGAVQTSYTLAFLTQPSETVYLGTTIAPPPAVALTESGVLDVAATGTLTMTDSARVLSGKTSEGLSSGTSMFPRLMSNSPASDDIFTASLGLNSSLSISAQASVGVNATPPVPPAIESPTPGAATVVGTGNVTFIWTPGAPVSSYDLWLGTRGVGSDNVYASGRLTTTSATAPRVPYGLATDTVYVRLWYLINETWQSIDYTYSATQPVAPVLTTPTPGTATILGTGNVIFTWTSGTGATLYDLWLGNKGVGSANVYVSGHLSTTSATVPKVPYGVATDTVYVRLLWLVNGAWQSIDYVYSATQSVAPVLTTPTPGTQLGASNITFTWTPGAGPTLYDFWLGTKGVASDNVYVSGRITTTSATAPKLPAKGATIYARLWYLVNDTWHSTDYTYTEQ